MGNGRSSTKEQDREENQGRSSTTEQDREENQGRSSTTEQDREENQGCSSTTEQDREENQGRSSTTEQDREENQAHSSIMEQDREENQANSSAMGQPLEENQIQVLDFDSLLTYDFQTEFNRVMLEEEARNNANGDGQVGEDDPLAFLDVIPSNQASTSEDAFGNQGTENHIIVLNKTISKLLKENKHCRLLHRKLQKEISDTTNRLHFFINESTEARSCRQQLEKSLAKSNDENKHLKEMIQNLNEDKLKRDPLTKALNDKVIDLEEQIINLKDSLGKNEKELNKSIAEERKVEELLRNANAKLRKSSPKKNKPEINQLIEENSEKDQQIQLLMKKERHMLELLNQGNIQNHPDVMGKESQVNGKFPLQLEQVSIDFDQKIQELKESEKRAHENEIKLQEQLSNAQKEIFDHKAFIKTQKSCMEELKKENMEQKCNIQELKRATEVLTEKISVIESSKRSCPSSNANSSTSGISHMSSVFKSLSFDSDPACFVEFGFGVQCDVSIAVSPIPETTEDRVSSHTDVLHESEALPETSIEDSIPFIQHEMNGENEETPSQTATFHIDKIAPIQPETSGMNKITTSSTCDKNEAASIQHEHYNQTVVTNVLQKTSPKLKKMSTLSELLTAATTFSSAEDSSNEAKLLELMPQISSCQKTSIPILKGQESLNNEAMDVEAEHNVTVFSANRDEVENKSLVASEVSRGGDSNITPVKNMHETDSKNPNAKILKTLHLDDLDELFPSKEESFLFTSKIRKIPRLRHPEKLNFPPIHSVKIKEYGVSSLKVDKQNLKGALKREYPSNTCEESMTARVNNAKKQLLELLEGPLMTEQQQSTCIVPTIAKDRLKDTTKTNEHNSSQCTKKLVPSVKPPMKTVCNSELLVGVLTPPLSSDKVFQEIGSISLDDAETPDHLQNNADIHCSSANELRPFKMTKSKRLQKAKSSHIKSEKKKKQASKLPRTPINVIQPKRDGEHLLESALDELEQIKFKSSQSDYKKFKHGFINVLKNPAVIQSTIEIVEIVCKRLASSTRDPFSSFIKGGAKDMDVLSPRIERCIVDSLCDLVKKDNNRFPNLLSLFLKAIIECILHDKLVSPRGLTAFCRTFGLFCRIRIDMQLEERLYLVWELLMHLKRFRETLFPFMAASILSVWPTAWELKGKAELDEKTILNLMLKPPHMLAEQEIKNSWSVCFKTINILFRKEIKEAANRGDLGDLSMTLLKIKDSQTNDESDSLKENEIEDHLHLTESFKKGTVYSTITP